MPLELAPGPDPFTSILLPVFLISAAASLMVPRLRQAVSPSPSNSALADYIPLTTILPDGRTVQSPAGHLTRCITVAGIDTQFVGDEGEILARLYELQKALDGLNDLDISELRIFHRRRRTPASIDPAEFSNPVARELAELDLQNLTTFRQDTFVISVTASGPKAMESVNTACDRLHTTLHAFGTADLVQPDGDSRDIKESLTSWWGWITAPVTMPRVSGTGDGLAEMLCADQVRFHDDHISFVSAGRAAQRSVVSFRTFGPSLDPAFANALSGLAEEFLICHLLVPVPRAMAMAKLARHRRIMRNSHFNPEEIDAAFDHQLQKISTNSARPATPWSYTPIFIPHVEGDAPDDSSMPSQLKRIVEEIIGIARDHQITAVADPDCVEAYFFNLFPGYAPRRPFSRAPGPKRPPRPRIFSPNSEQIARLATFSRPSEGKATNAFRRSSPLMVVPTIARTPYSLNLHVGDGDEPSGHTVVIGANGSGKTVLAQNLARCAGRFPLSVHLWDRKGGMKVFNTCLGGREIDFQATKFGLNPLQLQDHPRSREFLATWLGMLVDPDGRGLTPGAMAEINTAVDMMFMATRPHERNLRRHASTMFNQAGEVWPALLPWIDDTHLGRLFNAERDTLDLSDAKQFRYEMNSILEQPRVAPPLLAYLMFRIEEQMRNGNGAFVWFDETAALLLNDSMRDKVIPVALREWRKLLGAAALCFQVPTDLARLGVVDLVKTQCKTWFIFPNPTASREDYPLDLTDSMFAFIKGTHPLCRRARRPVAVIRPELQEAVVFDNDLSHYGKHLRLFASGSRSQELIEALVAEHGLNPSTIQLYLDHEAS